MVQGIGEELRGVDLGDERLNQRSLQVIEALAADPQASINGAMAGWAETQAAYRFFNNPNVTPERILQPHQQATLKRIRTQPVVLIAQDTTELDYSRHPPRDAGCLNSPGRLGMYHHVQLAMTTEQLPLGVVGTQNFDRPADSFGQPKKRVRRKHEPIEAKESFRWLEGYRRACEIAVACPETQIVSIADREADIYDFFVEAQTAALAGPRADYLIRAHEDRSTPERHREASRRTYHKVLETVRRSPVRTRHAITLSRTPFRHARPATLEVRALEVTVKPPNARGHLPQIRHHVVLAEEVDGPQDGTDVSWLLVTTLAIANADDLVRVLEHYVARWSIEVYFRTLKTGCHVEKLQLETKARLENCLAFYNVIAWRVLYLTRQNRTQPNRPCTDLFAEHEWKPVWCVTRKTPLPRTAPSLGERIGRIQQPQPRTTRRSPTDLDRPPKNARLRHRLDHFRPQLKLCVNNRPRPRTGQLPRLSRLMAIAIHFDHALASGRLRSQADLARAGQVTRARLSQIMNLCNLAPDLQEELLFLKSFFNGRAPITERQIRPIAAEPNWEKQRWRFKKLAGTAGRSDQ